MSDEIEREPCFHCGEPVALAGRVCRHCKGNLLIDVVLDVPPPDPRARYQLARGFASLDPPPIGFVAAREALGKPQSVLIAAVTRDVGRRALELVHEHGGRGHTVSTPETIAAPAIHRSGRVWKALALACLLALVGLGVYRSTSQPKTAEIFTIREVAARATPATVIVRCPNSLGSGFFVRDDLVLTNAHVLCKSGDPLRVVLSTGREVEAREFRRDNWLDIALVRVPGVQVPPLPLGDATVLQTGDPVTFIGTPQGLDFTVHEGMVSHRRRNLLGVSYLQIDANVNAGNSGGPLLDQHGRVVGIVSARLTESEGLGFVLPINYAYAGEQPLLEPPTDLTPDMTEWKLVVEKAAEEDRQEIAKLTSVGAVVDVSWLLAYPESKVKIGLVRFANTEPPEEPLNVTFRFNGSIVCQKTAVASEWYRVGPGEVPVMWMDPRHLQWLRRQGLDRNIFQGSVSINLAGCAIDDVQRVEIDLEDIGRHDGKIMTYRPI